MMGKALEQSILANISKQELIDLTRRLVAFKSENPPADYNAIAQFLQHEYQNAGLEVQIVAGQQDKPNVCARWKGSGESTEILLLSGHMDVVPSGEGWSHDPFEATIINNCLSGRGTADMKGALAAQFLAVKALLKAGVQPKGDLYLFATVDDETAGTMGLRYIVREGLERLGWPKPTFHILGEPSSLDLFVAFKGRMWVRIALRGRSAHGGNPQSGISAIEKMTFLLPEFLKIEKLTHPLMGTDTINIGTIQGGEKTNIVPDTCTVTIDYRYVTPQTSADIEAKLRQALARAAARDPEIKLKEFTVFERREPQELSQDNKYFQTLKSITEEVLARPVNFGGVLSAGDAYWTVSAGIPAVFYGPGDLKVAHTNKEEVPLDELEAATRIFALYALRMIGVTAMEKYSISN
jgi:succinyl-diaminopimelate desuccinylase